MNRNGQTTLQENKSGNGGFIKMGRKNRRLTFLVRSATNPDLYYEPYCTDKGLVCDSVIGPCKAWKRYAEHKTTDPCRHVLAVKDRLNRGLIEFKGMALTSLKAFREMLEKGMEATDKAELLDLLRRNPDSTNIELYKLWNAERRKKNLTGKRDTTVLGRMNWLLNNGFIQITGEKPNPDSEFMARTHRLAWEID